MEVAAPPGVEVVVTQPAEHLGDFEIVDFGDDPPVQRDGATVVTRWCALVGWSPGEHAIESPAVHYRVPGGELRDAAPDTTAVVVASVLGDADDSDRHPRHQAGPEAVPRRLAPVVRRRRRAGRAGRPRARLAVRGAAGAPARRGARRRRGRRTRSPLDALRALRARRLAEEGAFKEFYSALSDIVRRYLEDRFRRARAGDDHRGVPGRHGARRDASSARSVRCSATFLGESDLVKFARLVPTLADSERALVAAERFVDDTAEREPQPAEEPVRLADPWLLLLLGSLLLLLPRGRRAARRGRGALSRRSTCCAPSRPAARARAARSSGSCAPRCSASLVVALARPQLGTAETTVHREGVDIVLAVDVSGSMLAEDFTLDGKRASRVDVVKSVVQRVRRRRARRIASASCSSPRGPTRSARSRSITAGCCRTSTRASVGMIEDGTAIGSALATAVNRLRASTAQSKFVILLTDGQNNAGNITPETAAEAAAALGIKVYTIGAGHARHGAVPQTGLLRQHGLPADAGRHRRADAEADRQDDRRRYFRATDTESLREIYAEIDRAEKTPFEAPEFLDYHELYPWLLWPALALLLLEIGLGETVLRKLP